MPEKQNTFFAARSIEVIAWSINPATTPTALHIIIQATVFNRPVGLLIPLKTPEAADKLIAKLQTIRAQIWGSPDGATLKPDWKLPMSPAASCPHCKKKIIPCVVFTGDGWATYWDCENHCEPFADQPGGGMMVGEAFWPFIENHVKGSDWERAGFEVN